MKKIFAILLLALSSCQSDTKDITGHWSVVEQYSEGNPISPVNPGIIFRNDGILELEWNDKPNINVPETQYRVSNDTLYWSSVSGSNGSQQNGQLLLEWQEEKLILRADRNDYSVLIRTEK